MDILLNGLTLQLAGEVLFYDNSELDPFREYRRTYKACLSDVAFPILFGDNTLVAGGIPDRGGRRPGETLITTFDQAIKKFSMKSPPGSSIPDTPEVLLDPNAPNSSKHRNAIRDRIDRFCRNYELAPLEIQEWIKREADADFGVDDSVFNYRIPAGDYKYQKKIPAMICREIQDCIPRYFIGPMADSVASVLERRYDGRKIARSAVEEFVSRNTLTHMVIDYWYDLKFKEEMPGSSRQLPYITRRVSPESEMDQIKSIIMPHALMAVLKDCTLHEPASFRTVLNQKRDSPTFRKIREFSNDYFMESKPMRDETARKVLDLIDAIRQREGMPEGAIFGTRLDTRFKEAFPSLESDLESLIAAPGESDRLLDAIFPQFDKQIIAPRSGTPVVVQHVKNNTIGGSVVGFVGNSSNLFNPVTYPVGFSPEMEKIRSEYAALRAILEKLAVPEPKDLRNALEDADTEAAKPTPDKATFSDGLCRALKVANTADDFMDTIGKLVLHLGPIASWLGEHGSQLLSALTR